jgi:acyl-CoA thioester hydrolase
LVPGGAGRVTASRSAVRRMKAPFVWPVRVYWEDTDAGGIVYYANYLKFMERARTEWLRALGIEQEPLIREHGLMFVVVDVEAHFRKPARYGDGLTVGCDVAETTRATLTFKQDIRREGDATSQSDSRIIPAKAGNQDRNALLLEGQVRVACLDAGNHRPRALPAVLIERMKPSFGG